VSPKAKSYSFSNSGAFLCTPCSMKFLVPIHDGLGFEEEEFAGTRHCWLTTQASTLWVDALSQTHSPLRVHCVAAAGHATGVGARRHARPAAAGRFSPRDRSTCVEDYSWYRALL
jgi:hypothetical protein